MICLKYVTVREPSRSGKASFHIITSVLQNGHEGCIQWYSGDFTVPVIKHKVLHMLVLCSVFWTISEALLFIFCDKKLLEEILNFICTVFSIPWSILVTFKWNNVSLIEEKIFQDLWKPMYDRKCTRYHICSPEDCYWALLGELYTKNKKPGVSGVYFLMTTNTLSYIIYACSHEILIYFNNI